MANYSTLFSEVIADLTPEERAWLEWALKDPYELDEQARSDWMAEFGDLFEEVEEQGLGCEYKFDEEDSEYGEHLWLYSEDVACVDNVLSLVQAFLRKFRPGEVWTISWAETCSRPRVNEFGGGWAVVSAETVEGGTTWEIAAKVAESIKNPTPTKQDSHPCPYCSTPMGGPEMDYGQDGTSYARWRCSRCGAEEHVARYPSHSNSATCRICGIPLPASGDDDTCAGCRSHR